MTMHNIWTNIKTRMGLLKSIATYYWKPFALKRLRRFYGQFVSSGDLCFDLGAHVGNRTQAWVDLGARVIAVEPQPACVSYLRRRFRARPGVTIVEKALGASAGKATMHVNTANPTISTLSHAEWRDQLAHDARYPIGWDEQTEVDVVTLDDLITEYGMPVFCKLDIENYEYEALKGLSRPLPLLSFEYYPPKPENAFKCLGRLQEIGEYRYNWSFGESMRLNSEEWLDYQKITEILRGYSTRREYGDIYARLVSN